MERCINLQGTPVRGQNAEQRERKYLDMIKLLVGGKGTGKTKALISAVNEALETSKGYVVCIEKGSTLRHEINYKVRLVNTDDYLIDNGAALGGLVAGILAGNSDVTDLFIDGTRKICGYDMEALDKFLADLEKIVRDSDLNVTITVSCAPEDATETMKKYL